MKTKDITNIFNLDTVTNVFGKNLLVYKIVYDGYFNFDGKKAIKLLF